jgi:hypothetical protein
MCPRRHQHHGNTRVQRVRMVLGQQGILPTLLPPTGTPSVVQWVCTTCQANTHAMRIGCERVVVVVAVTVLR